MCRNYLTLLFWFTVAALSAGQWTKAWKEEGTPVALVLRGRRNE